MEKGISRFSMAFAGAALAAQVGTVGLAAEPHWDRYGRIERLDDRYHHGHYHVPRGVVVHELPAGYHPYWFHGSRFYFAAGVWYAPGAEGFLVVRPPAGLLVMSLPPYYTTVWIGAYPITTRMTCITDRRRSRAAMRSSTRPPARTNRPPPRR